MIDTSHGFDGARRQVSDVHAQPAGPAAAQSAAASEAGKG